MTMGKYFNMLIIRMRNIIISKILIKYNILIRWLLYVGSNGLKINIYNTQGLIENLPTSH